MSLIWAVTLLITVTYVHLGPRDKQSVKQEVGKKDPQAPQLREIV